MWRDVGRCGEIYSATPESLQARRASLRFAVGDEVECKTAQDEWSCGTVHSLLYRDDDLPQGVLAPYQVAPNPNSNPNPNPNPDPDPDPNPNPYPYSILTRWPWRTRVPTAAPRVGSSGCLRTTTRSSDRGAGAPSGCAGAAVVRMTTRTSTSTRTSTVRVRGRVGVGVGVA